MYTGGPMFWADTIGLEEVAERINHYASTIGGAHWSISPLIEQLVSEQGSLSTYTNDTQLCQLTSCELANSYVAELRARGREIDAARKLPQDIADRLAEDGFTASAHHKKLAASEHHRKN